MITSACSPLSVRRNPVGLAERYLDHLRLIGRRRVAVLVGAHFGGGWECGQGERCSLSAASL